MEQKMQFLMNIPANKVPEQMKMIREIRMLIHEFQCEDKSAKEKEQLFLKINTLTQKLTNQLS